jgi:hypothetical protein
MHNLRNQSLILNSKYKTSYLVVRRSSTLGNMARSSTTREAGIAVAFVAATTRLSIRGESGMIDQNIAATFQTVRPGCWSRQNSGGDSFGTRRRMRAFGNSHQM